MTAYPVSVYCLSLALIGFAGGPVVPLFKPCWSFQTAPRPKPLPNRAQLAPVTKAWSAGLASQLISLLSVRSSNWGSKIWQRGALADITWMCGLLNSVRWRPNAITHCSCTSLNLMQCFLSWQHHTHACHFPACGIEGFQMMFDACFSRDWRVLMQSRVKGVRIICCFTDTEYLCFLSVDRVQIGSSQMK